MLIPAMQKNTGILVVNLGSPDSPSVSSIRKYLGEFLMDSYVLNIPYLLRAALVYGVILPFRPKKTQHSYKAIWKPQGSPLIINTQKFADQLSKQLQTPVEIAMRYGTPSFCSALKKFKSQNIWNIQVVLMYPQYALSTTVTAQKRFEELNQKFYQNKFQFTYLQDFYAAPSFIEAVSDKIQANLQHDQHLLISFHGLPWSHLGKAVGASNCGTETCCDQISAGNKNCYRAQCFETARLIAKKINLTNDQWSIGFQSRLTRGWIEPFTDVVTQKLAARGIKNIAVVCPSFTADCLETLEEIEIREKAAFLKAGGKNLTYIPCVNDDPKFVDFIVNALKT